MSRKTEERKADLLKRTIAEMERWGSRPVLLELDVPTTLHLCGALQLALRHPRFGMLKASQAIHKIVTAIEESFPADFPAIKETIRLGFNQRFDEPHNEASEDKEVFPA